MADPAPNTTADVHRRETCRLCLGTNLQRVIALEPTPPANEYLTQDQKNIQQDTFPLDVMFCGDCAHVQLHDVVDPERLFRNYVYTSGTSPVFRKHFEELADHLLNDFGPFTVPFVVDIGSNDGTLLRYFKDRGCSVLGIDPAVDLAKAATESGIPTRADFFTPALAKKLLDQEGPASIITANNVFAHIDDLHSIVEGVRLLLSDDGIFVFEVSYLADVIEKTLFDTIYHEHLDYHTVKPLQKFFAANGMELIDAQRVNSHGGSLRGVVQRAGGTRTASTSVADLINMEEEKGYDTPAAFRKFEANINAIGEELSNLLTKLKAEGKSIAGYGAPAKATTLMHHYKLAPDLIDYIIDDNPLKQNLSTPGLKVPIVSSEALQTRTPDYLLILAWNFADPIIRNNQDFAKQGGRFIIPLPTVKVEDHVV